MRGPQSTVLLVALALLLTVAAYLVFQLLLSGQAPAYATEIAAAVFGGLLTAGVTMVLLNEQTKVEMRKDRSTAVLEAKITLYNGLIAELKGILTADDVTQHVVDVQLLCQSLGVIAGEGVVRAFSDFAGLFAEAARGKKLSTDAKDGMLEALATMSVEMRKDLMSKEEADAFGRPGVEAAFARMFDTSVKTLRSGKITWEDFLESCGPDEASYYASLRGWAESEKMKIEMGTVGFSIQATSGASLLWCFPGKSGKGIEVQFTRAKLPPDVADEVRAVLRFKGVAADKLAKKVVPITFEELDLASARDLLSMMNGASQTGTSTSGDAA